MVAVVEKRLHKPQISAAAATKESALESYSLEQH